MNFKVNFFFHLYKTHITPLGIPIPTVPRVSDVVGEASKLSTGARIVRAPKGPETLVF